MLSDPSPRAEYHDTALQTPNIRVVRAICSTFGVRVSNQWEKITRKSRNKLCNYVKLTYESTTTTKQRTEYVFVCGNGIGIRMIIKLFIFIVSYKNLRFYRLPGVNLLFLLFFFLRFLLPIIGYDTILYSLTSVKHHCKYICVLDDIWKRKSLLKIDGSIWSFR